jgi:hypothetical protein
MMQGEANGLVDKPAYRRDVRSGPSLSETQPRPTSDGGPTKQNETPPENNLQAALKVRGDS